MKLSGKRKPARLRASVPSPRSEAYKLSHKRSLSSVRERAPAREPRARREPSKRRPRARSPRGEAPWIELGSLVSNLPPHDRVAHLRCRDLVFGDLQDVLRQDGDVGVLAR